MSMEPHTRLTTLLERICADLDAARKILEELRTQTSCLYGPIVVCVEIDGKGGAVARIAPYEGELDDPRPPGSES